MVTAPAAWLHIAAITRAMPERRAGWLKAGGGEAWIERHRRVQVEATWRERLVLPAAIADKYASIVVNPTPTTKRASQVS